MMRALDLTLMAASPFPVPSTTQDDPLLRFHIKGLALGRRLSVSIHLADIQIGVLEGTAEPSSQLEETQIDLSRVVHGNRSIMRRKRIKVASSSREQMSHARGKIS